MTEKKAKFSSPPATRVSGLIVVCSMAMPSPMVNGEGQQHRKGRAQREEQRADKRQRKAHAQHELLAEMLNQQTGRIDMMP